MSASASPAPSSERVTEWEPHDQPTRPRGRVLIVVSFGAVIVGLLAFAALSDGYSRWGALLLAVLSPAPVLTRRRFLLSKTVPAGSESHARFTHLAQGLARDLALPPPRLLVSKKAGANAFVVPGALAVTEDLLAAYTRTELEAVVAHCLVRVRDGGLGWAVAASAVHGFGRVAPPVDRHVDARVAAVTRYPPALASAIKKATPARGHDAPLWFVADSPSHAPAAERAAELLDL